MHTHTLQYCIIPREALPIKTGDVIILTHSQAYLHTPDVRGDPSCDECVGETDTLDQLWIERHWLECADQTVAAIRTKNESEIRGGTAA